MGGQSLKFRKKQAREVAAQVEIGKAKGQLKAMKHLKWTEQLQLFAAKLADKMNLSDAMEGIAVIGATIIIKHGIDWTQTPVPKTAVKIFLPAPIQTLQILQDLIAYLKGETTQAPPQTTQEEILEWLMAFSLAYVIIHNFGDIAKAATSILSLATSLLGTIA